VSFQIKIKEKFFHNKHDKKKTNVLKNINITIKPKEFVCIVGPSGCGKTTLMNMIGGLIDSESQVIKSTSRDTVEVEKFGYVFQTLDYSHGSLLEKMLNLFVIQIHRTLILITLIFY
tara:strand:+ start:98 stop:448 length:351 start_codon:yes stop_codon:yes gene_type:complete